MISVRNSCLDVWMVNLHVTLSSTLLRKRMILLHVQDFVTRNETSVKLLRN